MNKGTPIELWAARGSILKGRNPTIRVEAKVSPTGLIDLGAALRDLPKFKMKDLPYFNESAIMPCVVALTEAEANAELNRRLLNLAEDYEGRAKIYRNMIDERPGILGTPLRISDEDAIKGD